MTLSIALHYSTKYEMKHVEPDLHNVLVYRMAHFKSNVLQIFAVFISLVSGNFETTFDKFFTATFPQFISKICKCLKDLNYKRRAF